jgi:hypothetical protein
LVIRHGNTLTELARGRPQKPPLTADNSARRRSFAGGSGVELSELTKQVKRGRQRFTHTYRWLCDVPLRDGADAMTVNWLMIEIRNAAGEVTYRNSFITDLPADRDTVVELAACGRARWKIENESFST